LISPRAGWKPAPLASAKERRFAEAKAAKGDEESHYLPAKSFDIALGIVYSQARQGAFRPLIRFSCLMHRPRKAQAVTGGSQRRLPSPEWLGAN